MAFGRRGRSQKTYSEEELYEYAIGALGRRMRTVAEMKRLLRLKSLAGDKDAIIEGIVARLKDHKYLNDTRYAEMYSTLRKEGGKLGRQRVITDLKVKGVHANVIDQTVAATYAGTNDEQLAREYLAKKRIKVPKPAKRGDRKGYQQHQKETAKIFRALVRAGFRSTTIFKVLKSVGAEDEVLSALEEEPIEEPRRPGDTEE